MNQNIDINNSADNSTESIETKATGNDRGKRIASVLYLIATFLYAGSVFQIASHNTAIGLILLCFGSTSMCLAGLNANKSASSEKNE
ncbi:MAG: hypothetical protein Q4B67_08100 [Eubacteriales bacterium]|nr:hypothetical protein [Eubacteriales bacterium]